MAWKPTPPQVSPDVLVKLRKQYETEYGTPWPLLDPQLKDLWRQARAATDKAPQTGSSRRKVANELAWQHCVNLMRGALPVAPKVKYP